MQQEVCNDYENSSAIVILKYAHCTEKETKTIFHGARAKKEEGNDCAHSITSNLQPLPAATLT